MGPVLDVAEELWESDGRLGTESIIEAREQSGGIPQFIWPAASKRHEFAMKVACFDPSTVKSLWPNRVKEGLQGQVYAKLFEALVATTLESVFLAPSAGAERELLDEAKRFTDLAWHFRDPPPYCNVYHGQISWMQVQIFAEQDALKEWMGMANKKFFGLNAEIFGNMELEQKWQIFNLIQDLLLILCVNETSLPIVTTMTDPKAILSSLERLLDGLGSNREALEIGQMTLILSSRLWFYDLYIDTPNKMIVKGATKLVMKYIREALPPSLQPRIETLKFHNSGKVRFGGRLHDHPFVEDPRNASSLEEHLERASMCFEAELCAIVDDAEAELRFQASIVEMMRDDLIFPRRISSSAVLRRDLQKLGRWLEWIRVGLRVQGLREYEGPLQNAAILYHRQRSRFTEICESVAHLCHRSKGPILERLNNFLPRFWEGEPRCHAPLKSARNLARQYRVDN